MAVLLGALTLVCGVGLLATAAWLISRAAQRPPMLTLTVAIVSVRAFGIGRGVFRYAERQVAHDAVLQVLGEVRARVFEALVAAEPSRQISMRRTDSLVTLVRDVDALQYLPLRVYLPASACAAALLACVAVEGLIDPVAAVLVAALSVAGVVVAWIGARAGLGPRSRTSSTMRERAEHDIAAAVGDAMAGAADIAMLGAHDAVAQKVLLAQRRVRERSRRDFARDASGSGVMLLLTGMTVAALAARLVPRMHSGTLSPVLLATAVLLPIAMSEVFALLVSAAAAWRQGVPALLRMAATLGSASLADGSGTASMAAVVAPPRTPTAEAALAAHDVTARWPGAQRDAVSGVSLEVKAGKTLAVSGESGCGKSTLVAALAGLLAASGDVRVCGEPVVVGGDDTALRRDLAVAEQEPWVFTTSVAENLRLAAPQDVQVDDAMEWQALDAVGLAAWVRAQPAALETLVGAGGVQLSGGQRRRLSLARLLMGNARVWLLDEPSEHLNEAAAAEVRAAMARYARGAGLARIIVSHHDEDLLGADSVLHVRLGQAVALREHT